MGAFRQRESASPPLTPYANQKFFFAVNVEKDNITIS